MKCCVGSVLSLCVFYFSITHCLATTVDPVAPPSVQPPAAAATTTAATTTSTTTARLDLAAVMKKMRLAYQQAMDSSDSQAFLTLLDTLEQLTNESKTAQFPSDRRENLLAGLDKVLSSIQLARVSASQGDLELAKSHLQQLDQLRKHYHKQRQPSFWQRLFGQQ